MTLDDIQNAIFEGHKGVEAASKLISIYIEKKKPNYEAVAILQDLVNKKSKTISVPFVNQIQITQRYRNYIKSFVPEQGRIINCRDAVLGIVSHAEAESNKRILDAREPQTKRNRQYEKNEVMKFFQKNYASLVALLELHNLFVNIKDEINRKTDGIN